MRVRASEAAISQMAALGCFADHVLVAEKSCIAIPEGVPFDRACLVGCAVMTGAGAVINTAQVQVGSTCVIIGCGGVGLNTLQGCVLAGAATIIAVDTLSNKLEYARSMGATHTVDASKENVLEVVRSLTGGRGADYAFEVVGDPRTIELAYTCTHRAGTAVVVSGSAGGDNITLPSGLLFSDRVLRSCVYGSARPHSDIPRLLQLYLRGKLKLDELVTRSYPLEGINEAFAALANGEVARSVLIMSE
jgi:Zn-dependent alcohol dehydrogenase